LTIHELPGRVRLCLGTLTHGTGPTLQDSADDLVQRLLGYTMALHGSGLPASRFRLQAPYPGFSSPCQNLPETAQRV